MNFGSETMLLSNRTMATKLSRWERAFPILVLRIARSGQTLGFGMLCSRSAFQQCDVHRYPKEMTRSSPHLLAYQIRAYFSTQKQGRRYPQVHAAMRPPEAALGAELVRSGAPGSLSACWSCWRAGFIRSVSVWVCECFPSVCL